MLSQGEEKKIHLAHLTLRAKQWGDPKKPPMLALHGWLDNAGSFDFLAPLIQDSYVLALDLPGHGLSSHLPQGTHYHLLDSVSLMFEVLDQLHWQKTFLLGHSMGGGIASLMAGSLPERIEKLILIDSLGPLSEQALQSPERLSDTLKKMTESNKKPKKIYATLDQMIEKRMLANGLSRKTADALIQRGTQAIPGGFQWRFDPRLLLPSLLYLTEEQVQAFLSHIQADTLLLLADDGLIIQNAMLDQRIACITHLQSVIVPGHHHTHMDHPKAIAQQINAFIASSATSL